MKYSEPQYLELTPEMKKRLDDFRDAHQDDPNGGVGGRITNPALAGLTEKSPST